MGLFSKIKNFITGGGVRLSLQIVNESYLRKPFDVELIIAVEDQDIEADLIYIDLKYLEEVSVSVNTRNAQGHYSTIVEKEYAVLYEEKIMVEENFILEAGQEYTYVNTIQLPLEAFPSFEGVNSKLIWSMEAFVQKAGNDPNSEKLIFEPLYDFG